MKTITTTDIVRAFRNSTTPAACLAAWQGRGIRRNLARLREKYASGRDYYAKNAGPEMSSPEADAPLLWISNGDSPEVLNSWKGREFLDHRGWYTMDDDMGETIETCAVRLARFPRLMFYATCESETGDLCVHLDDWEEIDFSEANCSYSTDSAVEDAARRVIRSNDNTTEQSAEESREYFEQDQRGQEISRNREELKEVRESARRLIAELRELCPTLGSKYPAAAEAVQGALRGLLRERRTLIARNEELANA